MAITSGSRKSPLTPAKMVLIAVLAMVLVGVLIGQFRDSGSSEAVSRRRSAPEEVAPTGKTVAGPPARQRPPWPATTVTQATRHDPFQMPMVLLEPPPEVSQTQVTVEPSDDELQRALRLRQQQEFVRSLREQGVSMVILGDRGHVARIGNHHLREGDLIQGMRVASIGPDGVKLIPVEHDSQRATSNAEQTLDWMSGQLRSWMAPEPSTNHSQLETTE